MAIVQKSPTAFENGTADRFAQTSVTALLVDMWDEASPQHVRELSRPIVQMKAGLSGMQLLQLGMPLVQKRAYVAGERHGERRRADLGGGAPRGQEVRSEFVARARAQPTDRAESQHARTSHCIGVVVLAKVGSSARGQLAMGVVLMSGGVSVQA